MSSNRVSILIPAYMAEGFIDRTLRFARGQTHRDVSILVSIDESADGTAEVVQPHVVGDDRVQSFVHDTRLGWAANVNFLLDQVDTPYAFLYFHDDVIVPQYVECLVDALRNRPDAASAHCTMGHFGGRADLVPGRAYEGTAGERLLQFFLAPNRGSPLRSMLRVEHTLAVRMPDTDVTGLWANEPFLVALIAAGPAIHVADTLYYRWDQREGGLTEGWKGLSGEAMLEGWQANIAAAISVASSAAGTDDERDALMAAVLLRFLAPLAVAEERAGEVLFERPEDLDPAFTGLDPSTAFSECDEEIRSWAAGRWTTALRRKPSLQP